MDEKAKKKRISEKTLSTIFFLLVLLVLLASILAKPRSLILSFETSYKASVGESSGTMESVKAAISSSEMAIADRIGFKTAFNELYGAFQSYTSPSRRYISDINYGYLYKTKYDQIAFTVQRVSDEELNAAADRLSELSESLSEEDIAFEFVSLPYKLPPESIRPENQLPQGFFDYANENADRLHNALRERGVRSFDVRPAFWGSDMSQNELFFNTDHHWSIEGAFLGTGILAEHLNEDYDFGIKEGLYDKANFDFITMKENFIGSLGRRVGRVFGGIDDFTLIKPNFENNIRLLQYDSSGNLDLSGSFDDVILEKEKYIEPSDKTTNRYAVYHGDYRELRFINENAGNGSRILIIKDSFGLPVYSFLSLGVEELRAIDLRLFKSDVAAYAKEFKPDLVIVMYNCDCFRDRMFEFGL